MRPEAVVVPAGGAGTGWGCAESASEQEGKRMWLPNSSEMLLFPLSGGWLSPWPSGREKRDEKTNFLPSHKLRLWIGQTRHFWLCHHVRKILSTLSHVPVHLDQDLCTRQTAGTQ